MTRPRFTLTRIALGGAGLLTAAGIGAATIPSVIASSPTAAVSTVPAPSNAAPAQSTPAAGQKAKGKNGRKATLARLGIVLRRMLVRETATQTGTSVKQVRAELRSGRSLDSIAGAKAQAVAGAVLADITKRLDTARTNGRITQAQETKLLGRAQDRITKVMAVTPKPKAPKATPTAAA